MEKQKCEILHDYYFEVVKPYLEEQIRALKAEVQDLKARNDRLQDEVRRLNEEMKAYLRGRRSIAGYLVERIDKWLG